MGGRTLFLRRAKENVKVRDLHCAVQAKAHSLHLHSWGPDDSLQVCTVLRIGWSFERALKGYHVHGFVVKVWAIADRVEVERHTYVG